MLNILKDPKKISHIFFTVWILIFDKRKDWCHLTIFLYFIMSVSVTCYSIFVDVALVIEAAE